MAWWYLAPAQIGGQSTYVSTHGISMEPRFHTGDLVIVRPAASYKVGQIVAYHSELLNTTVLHRIVAKHGNLYVFKGDNNDFIDPRPVPRKDLIGKLWVHVPRGGIMLSVLHTPIGAAILCALVGFLFLFGVNDRQRRRRRRRSATGSGHRGPRLVNDTQEKAVTRSSNLTVVLTASAVAAAVFFVLAVIAFTHPDHKSSAVTTPYTQQVKFGYSAHAQAGPVYPTGRINTGDPIFLNLVHRLDVQVAYSFATAAQHEVTGTEEIVLELTGQSGWSRSLVLVPATRFSGDKTTTDVTLDLPQLESLLTKVGSLTGVSSDAGYTIAVESRVQVDGTVGGHEIDTSFAPAMGFQLSPAQLLSEGATATAGTSATSSGAASGVASPASLAPSQTSSIGTPTSTPNSLGLLEVSLEVTLLRWFSLLGLILSGGIALYAFLRKRAEPFEETVRIQGQYGHLIVPILAGEDLGWPPVDVPSIKSLVRLAESGQRLILHNRSDNVDTYMVNDEGTVYRYQVRPAKVVWGEWNTTPTVTPPPASVLAEPVALPVPDAPDEDEASEAAAA